MHKYMIDACLAQTGWEFKLQFVSGSSKQASDLIEDLYFCISNDTKSNLDTDDITDNLLTWGIKPNNSINCLKDHGWEVITMAPWVTIDTINDKTATVINIPLNNYLISSNAKSDVNIYNDNNSALSWTIIQNNDAYSWTAAVNAINELNKSAYGGYSDWHVPSKSEFEYFLSGKSESSLKAILRQMANKNFTYDKCYLYWTSTYPEDYSDKNYAINLFSNSFSLIDTFEPFACKLIAVRGKGWSK
ncbi:DUF1566 domain-containing protein [Geobacter sp. OR-1]|uniref:Lcl domain-containing protein n=1 Tax=Geobacter sp. OR-1 TaxID=1266765 RepID=UPI0005A5D61B|nr:DUF1566 domain-containing protein [Geobacter sp. OR-1]